MQHGNLATQKSPHYLHSISLAFSQTNTSLYYRWEHGYGARLLAHQTMCLLIQHYQ